MKKATQGSGWKSSDLLWQSLEQRARSKGFAEFSQEIPLATAAAVFGATSGRGPSSSHYRSGFSGQVDGLNIRPPFD